MPIAVETHRRAPVCTAVLGGALLAFACLIGARAAAPASFPDVRIDDTDVYPESMTAKRDGTLFIGSMKGIIFRAAPGSTSAHAWVRPTRKNGLLTIFGVLADERSRTLWVCSSPSPLRKPPAIGTAALMAFDLETGRQKGVYPFPPPASICNDVTIARDGTAYVSDTPNGRILRLKRAAKRLTVFAQDPRLKGIDGLVFSSDQVLYANIVTRGLLLRVDRTPDGHAGTITQLTTSRALGGPDGFRLLHGRTFVLAEGTGGRIDEVTIDGNQARINVLRDGLVSPAAVTPDGPVAYTVEGKIGYLFDPKLKGKDPGPFIAHPVPLTD